jgi:SAM-dependent methyltransferase
LDLGCGPRDQAVPIDHLGHKYVGIDISNAAADILADAHSIPFKSMTFDCVLSYATLEHLHNPFLAITEVERVLKPGGIFVGTVSQGEPFHASYFHHTVWGLISLVTAATSMSILRMWASGDTLGSLARMGRYPKVIKSLLRALNLINEKVPYLAPRKMKWSQEEKRLDELYRAGSICFVMQKPIEG